MDTKVNLRNSDWLKFVRLGALLWVMICLAGMGLNCDRLKEESLQRGNEGVTANYILDKIGFSRGICVVLADKNCDLALQLALKSELLIYVQLTEDEDVEAARRAVDTAGFYGTRIYVEKGTLTKIHLADNIADVLVALNEAQGVPETEVLRVLHPQGKALIGQKELIKPFPEGVDDWSHPYHGADNNTQSRDLVARAPYLTQFLAEPRYAPLTQVAVASAGRVFKAFGNIAFHKREEPFLNTLVAFNGYNGTLLWKRDLVPGIMVHRNTIIATPKILYVGDDRSCKLIDTATGRLVDEIIPPTDIAGGTFWKWMGMENGVLYALIGEQEQKDPVMRWRRTQHGWPWNAISKGFNQPEHSWGFGRNIVAIDPETKKVLWHFQEDEPIDSRALCMKDGRIFLFRFGSFLTCLDAKTGKKIWRKTRENAPDLFNSLGKYLYRQSWQSNWRTTDYLMCSDQALYFAGPQVSKLLAVSAKDGSVLWENPYNNFQLILRDDGLYGISGPWRDRVSKKIDPLTGEILADLATGRRACTRPNASIDAIFYRAMGGTVRFDLPSRRQHWISPMRPPCHDGVTIANGLLYWWPSICDCQLSIYGITCLGPAGDFDFSLKATEAERLEKGTANLNDITPLLQTSTDWPTFRKDNYGSVSTEAVIATEGAELWRFPPNKVHNPGTDILGHAYYTAPTAPVTVDGLVFFSGSDGIVRALDAQTGKLLWTAYTGGAVRFPPTIWKNRALISSGDGWVYSFDAKTGRLLWRFRAAPAERKIPVYGSLLSTWPTASGVLVDEGIAYVAAGILNYDGTYIYALDAETGKIIWQNNTSGHLDREARTGVSVQGHLLLHDGKLYLAGGTSISPAIYDISNGKCLNDPEPLGRCESFSPRGWELFKIGDRVVASGKPFYAHPKYPVYDHSVFNKLLIASSGDRDIAWISNRKLVCYNHIDTKILNDGVAEQKYTGYRIPIWGKLNLSNEPLWEYNCEESVALATCKNAVVVAGKSMLIVLNLEDGKELWTHALNYSPVPWGLAVGRDGQIIVTLENGAVLCFGRKT